MDYVKAVSPVDILEVENAPVQKIENETSSAVSSINPPINNENIAETQEAVFNNKTDEHLQPTNKTNEDQNSHLSNTTEVLTENVKNQVNNLQIQIEDHSLNNNNSTAEILVSNGPSVLTNPTDLQLPVLFISNDTVTESNANETFQTDTLRINLQEPVIFKEGVEVLQTNNQNVTNSSQKLYVEKSSTVIQVIEQNHIPLTVKQGNEEDVPSGSESDSGNSENDDLKYSDANEFHNAATDKGTTSTSKNISTLNIVLTNSHTQKFALVADDSDLQNKNSLSNELASNNILNEPKAEAAAENVSRFGNAKSQPTKYLTKTETVEIGTEIPSVEKNETVLQSDPNASEEKPGVSTLSRKDKKSIAKLKKIAHQRAKDKKILRTSSRSSSEGISDSSDSSVAKNKMPDANTLEVFTYNEPQNNYSETAADQSKSSCDANQSEKILAGNTPQQTENVNLVSENINGNDQLLKTSTTVQVAQNSSKTITAPVKRPSKIPVSLQRSTSKCEPKSPEATSSSKIPIKSTVQTQIPKLSAHKTAGTKHVAVTVQQNKLPDSEQQEFTNTASIVLQNTESARQSIPSTSQKSNDVAVEMEHSVQTIKDINRQLMQQKPYLSKKNSVESTTSSKQLSYTKSLDNDSDSSVSDSNVEELLDPSTEEDSYEDIEEYEEVVESDTEEYNQFDEQNIKSVNELNINLSQINEKVRELTSTLNNADESRKHYISRNSYIEETCESEEYISDDDDEDDESEAQNLQQEVELKTDLNIEIKQPTELELMQVSLL